MKSLNCLIIATSNNKSDDTGSKTGVWLEGLAAPYFIFKDGGEMITIASPHGGQIPLDAGKDSTVATTNNTSRFQRDPQAMYRFSHSLPINEVKTEDFDLVFLAGGHGAMSDFVNDKKLKQILEDFNRQDKPIGLVGHGVAALISLTLNNGEPLVKERRLTAFSNSEEQLAKMNGKPPFLLESRLKSLGALYSKGPDFTSYVVSDGNIITGQNSASAADAVRQLLILARATGKFKSSKPPGKSIQTSVLGDKRIH